jgi:hypothetical protein
LDCFVLYVHVRDVHTHANIHYMIYNIIYNITNPRTETASSGMPSPSRSPMARTALPNWSCIVFFCVGIYGGRSVIRCYIYMIRLYIWWSVASGTSHHDTAPHTHLDVQLVVPPKQRGDQGGLLHRAVLVHEKDVDGPALLAHAHGADRQLGHAVTWWWCLVDRRVILVFLRLYIVYAYTCVCKT